MNTYRKHLLVSGSTIRQALERLDILAKDAIIFIIDNQQKLIGSLTDGDVRRGLLKGVKVTDKVDGIIQPSPKFLMEGEHNIDKIISYRKSNFRILPVIDNEGVVVKVINFRYLNSYLPVEAVIMAGGRGARLRPITDSIPKPMIQLGGKPIIEHNIDRLISYGIEKIYISVNYLKEKIMDCFGDGASKGIQIEYIEEDKPLGTAGALSLVEKFDKDVLLTNSDLFTSIDYEEFYVSFKKRNADLAVASIPYTVNIPYAILEGEQNNITNFKEKPSNTHYANAGIYLLNKNLINHIPQNEFYNTTDLMQYCIDSGRKIIHNPLIGYWIDIGKHEDLDKAQEIAKHI